MKLMICISKILLSSLVREVMKLYHGSNTFLRVFFIQGKSELYTTENQAHNICSISSWQD
jgi:hypothetical protein